MVVDEINWSAGKKLLEHVIVTYMTGNVLCQLAIMNLDVDK